MGVGFALAPSLAQFWLSGAAILLMGMLERGPHPSGQASQAEEIEGIPTPTQLPVQESQRSTGVGSTERSRVKPWFLGWLRLLLGPQKPQLSGQRP